LAMLKSLSILLACHAQRMYLLVIRFNESLYFA